MFFLQYMVLIMVIFMVESVMALLSYVYQDLVESDLNNNLQDIFIKRYDVDREVTEAVDKVQQEVEYFSDLILF